MTQFNHHSLNSAPENSKEQLVFAKKKFGQIPNLQAVMATSPVLLKGYQMLYELGADTNFTAIELQVIYLTVSYYNDCNYCMAAHSFQAKNRDKMPKEILEALRKNLPIPAPKLEVLRNFVIEILETKGSLKEERYATFLSAGYSPKSILEIVLLIAVKVMSNYTNKIAKPQLDKVLLSQVWSKNFE